MQRTEIDTEKYYRYEFPSVMNSRDLIKFVVLSVDPILKDQRPGSKKRGQGGKMKLGECVVARERDLGDNDTQFTVISHLGNILKEGDIVLGYDLTTASWTNDSEVLEQLPKGVQLPDIILVRKVIIGVAAILWLALQFSP